MKQTTPPLPTNSYPPLLCQALQTSEPAARMPERAGGLCSQRVTAVLDLARRFIFGPRSASRRQQTRRMAARVTSVDPRAVASVFCAVTRATRRRLFRMFFSLSSSSSSSLAIEDCYFYYCFRYRYRHRWRRRRRRRRRGRERKRRKRKRSSHLARASAAARYA